MLAEEKEDLAKVLSVFSLVLAINKNIIKVDDDKLIQKVMEDIVHQSHESGRRVSQTKGKNQKLVVSEVIYESRLEGVL